jgi:3-hydroxybutyrate dehydrogenase
LVRALAQGPCWFQHTPDPRQISFQKGIFAILKGKTALVTGSTSGIGQSIADALAAQGCNVVLNGFGKPHEIEELRSSMALTHGVAVRYDAADMSSPQAIETMMRRAIHEFGGIV